MYRTCSSPTWTRCHLISRWSLFYHSKPTNIPPCRLESSSLHLPPLAKPCLPYSSSMCHRQVIDSSTPVSPYLRHSSLCSYEQAMRCSTIFHEVKFCFFSPKERYRGKEPTENEGASVTCVDAWYWTRLFASSSFTAIASQLHLFTLGTDNWFPLNDLDISGDIYILLICRI